jgi:zinc transport system substrate-binding protein
MMLGFALTLTTTGCFEETPPPDKPQVVAAIYPLAFVAEQVAGSRADVTTLVPPGVEPHEYELTASQIASLESADIVIYQRGISPALDAAIAQNPPRVLVETGSLVALLPANPDDQPGWGEGTDNPSNPLDAGFDPHTWLNPANMSIFATVFADKLVEVDPNHKQEIGEAAQAFQVRLAALDDEFRTQLTTCDRREFVTSHAAFAYLAISYDLKQIAIAGISPEDEPSPARLAEVASQVRSAGITTVFYETLVSPDYADMLASELGLKTDVLDPVESIVNESRGNDYIEVMESNLAALRVANGCH